MTTGLAKDMAINVNEIDMTDDRRIYFLYILGNKMTDGNGRPLLFFPEDALYHFNESA